MATYPTNLVGMPATSIFTSVQGLIASKMFSIMKDCATGKQRNNWRLTEKVVFVYVFLSPLVYTIGGAVYSATNVWTFGNYLYLAESVAILTLLLITARIIYIAGSVGSLGSNRGKVKQLWYSCAAAALMGVGQSLVGLQLFGAMEQPVYDSFSLMQGYYLYHFFAPKQK